MISTGRIRAMKGATRVLPDPVGPTRTKTLRAAACETGGMTPRVDPRSPPALLPDEGHELEPVEALRFDPARIFPEDMEMLDLEIPDRYDDTTLILQLVHERLRHAGSSCGYEDAVERGEFAPPDGAVGALRGNLILMAVKPPACLVQQRHVPFD